MDSLPSYQQAITRPDWLQIAAPYIAFEDYPTLCQVSRRFWLIFAPRLWRDPCAASKRLGWSRDGDTTRWWAKFTSQTLFQLTWETRHLIRVLDARGATGPREFSIYPELTRKNFQLALEVLPKVLALILDDHVGLNVRFLGLISGAPWPLGHELRVLSLNNVTDGVLTALAPPYGLPKLMYLDISGTLFPSYYQPLSLLLPWLRIFKIRGSRLGLHDAEISPLNISDSHLWSLDLSDNHLTDRYVKSLLCQLDHRHSLDGFQHAATDGVLLPWRGTRHADFLGVGEVHGSSNVFLPGDRYLVDAPAFRASPFSDEDMALDVRSDGSMPIRLDTLDGVLQLLSQENGLYAIDHLPGSGSLTHLHLSGNQFSAVGIDFLLRHSSGHLEHFDCDSMRLYMPDVPPGCRPEQSACEPSSNSMIHMSKSFQIYGFSGFSQIFRPVWCANLRTLRIHHSLVTNVPTVKISDCCAAECLYLTERQIFPNLDWAYPMAFLPDMNPRLESLTLTCVPRQSFGPLVHKLSFFIRLLGLQEQALSIMTRAEESRPGRPVRLLSGLRHLTLEMEPREEMGAPLDLDAGEIMASVESQFSFFDTPVEDLPPKEPSAREVEVWRQLDPNSLPPPSEDTVHAANEIEYRDAARYLPAVSPGEAHRDLSKEKWIICRPTQYSRRVVVWAGNTWSPNRIVREYRNLVIEFGVHEDPRPVNINHKRAGAPRDCLIFRKTWFFAALPQHLEIPPNLPPPMFEDVAAELRRRHVSTFEEFERVRRHSPHRPCFYWGGTFKIIEDGSNVNN